jgi:transcriptional regulator with XRE-family HTH domain
MSAAAKILRLRPSQPIKLDEGPESVAWIASEIRLSNVSYKDLSQRCGVCTQAISNIASGDTKLPRWSTIVKIALALGWSIYAHNDRA